jgi:hypothetical protein
MEWWEYGYGVVEMVGMVLSFGEWADLLLFYCSIVVRLSGASRERESSCLGSLREASKHQNRTASSW